MEERYDNPNKIDPEKRGNFKLDEKARQLDEEIVLLNQRTNQLNFILNSIPEAVIVTNQDGHLVFNNRTANEFFGGEIGDFDPEMWAEKYGFFLDDEKTYFPSRSLPLVRALNGEPVQGEEILLRTAGSQDTRYVTMDARPLRDESGELSGAILIIRDITYRKKIELSRERQARRAEALYTISRSIAEIGNDLPQIMNAVVAHTANIIGDACIATLVGPDQSALKIAAVHHPVPEASALLKEYMVTTEYNLHEGIIGGVVESGEPLLIPSISLKQQESIALTDFEGYPEPIGIYSLLIVPIKGRQGVMGTLGLSRDRGEKPYTSEDQSFLMDIANRTGLAIEHISLVDSLRREIAERKAAETALIESEMRSRSIFESTTVGIKVLDLEGHILQTNPAFQEMTGYSSDDLVRMHFSSFLHPSDSTRMLVLFEKVKNNITRGFRLEHRIIHKDGSIVWVATTFTGVRQTEEDGRLAFIAGIVENTTEKKRIELEVIEVKNQLHRNLEMERLRLAQELHDGPMQELYSAIFQIDSLQRMLAPNNQEVLDMVKNDIKKVVVNLRSTTQELRPPTLAGFGLEKAIRSHAEEIQEKHPELNIYLSLARDQQMLPEDVRLTLFRIYQHSIANILRHAEASEVHVRFVFDVEEARLVIEDNGKGFVVPPGWISLTRQGHFGLAGAAERVEALGGVFEVESQPGHGTIVRAVIKRSEADYQ